MDNDHRNLIAVGKIVRPVGLRGEMKVNMLTDDPHRLEAESEVFVGKQAADAQSKTLGGVRLSGNAWIVKFVDVETRDGAEGIRDCFLFLAERTMRSSKRGSYRIDDIVGCAVETTDGRSVGTVADVMALPANDVWVVRLGDQEFLVPAVREIIRSVDISGKRIVVAALEGLFE